VSWIENFYPAFFIEDVDVVITEVKIKIEEKSGFD